MQDKQNNKILILGASGFLGAHLVADSISRGFDTVAATKASSNLWRLTALGLANKVFLAKAELTNPLKLEKLIIETNPDIVINSCAYGVNPQNNDIETSFTINTHMPLQLLNIIVKHKPNIRFIHLGSCFEYGNKNHSIKENEMLVPTAFYGATKAAASILLQQQALQFNVDFCLLRIFSLWGALENDYRLAPQIIKACQKKRSLSLTACDQIRDYTYVTDMASYILDIATLTHFPKGEIINLGNGSPTVLKDFVLSIARYFDQEKLMKFGELPYRENEMHQLQADTKKQSALLGQYKKTSISDGIQHMLTYMK